MRFSRRTALVLLWLVAVSVRGDSFADFVWYRAEPELSRIVISRESVRGRTVVERLAARKEEFAKGGRYWLDDNPQGKVQRIVRKDAVDGHAVETTVAIYPPVGHGPCGALPSADVTVVVDGIKKVECPLGETAATFGTSIERIELHLADGVVQVSSTSGGGAAALIAPDNDGRIVWKGRLVEVSQKREREERLRQARQQAIREAKALKKYDLDGDGKLNAEELARSKEAEKNQLQAPPLEP